jgi:opacity protein-like surface antigen
MKHLAFASLIAVAQAATTSINAADLPPSVPPSAPAHVLTVPYSWTGFYLGGHVGGARVEDRATAVSTWHVGFNVGYRLDQNWRVMATYDHSSAGQAVTGCPANESLNQAGLKFGYQF